MTEEKLNNDVGDKEAKSPESDNVSLKATYPTRIKIKIEIDVVTLLLLLAGLATRLYRLQEPKNIV